MSFPLKLTITTSDQVDDKQTVSIEVRESFFRAGFQVDDYGLVSWLEGSPAHPRNWKIHTKCFDTAFIIVFEFIATLFTNVGVPAASHSQGELDISQELAIVAFSTIHHFGLALGTILLTPYAARFGRRRSYIVACVVYAVGCFITVAPRHIAGVFFGRFISGFASAIPATIAGESLEELWAVRGRAWANFLWIGGAVLGLAVGPVVATFLTTTALGGWRSMFWIACMCSSLLAVFAIFMSETRATSIVEDKVKEMSQVYGPKSVLTLHCIENQSPAPPTTVLLQGLLQPLKLLLTEPIIMIISLLNATLYATIYLLGEAVQVIYPSFGFSERQSSLVNLAVGIGLAFSVLVRALDHKLANDKIRKGRLVTPEDKLVGFYVAAPALAVAAWWFAWSVPPAVSPADFTPWVSIFALVFVGFACSEFDYVLTTYLTETYTTHAPSANAALEFFRAVLCGIYPLFGTQMFVNLGNSIAGSILAAFATIYCLVSMIFYMYGSRMRGASGAAG